MAQQMWLASVYHALHHHGQHLGPKGVQALTDVVLIEEAPATHQLFIVPLLESAVSSDLLAHFILILFRQMGLS